MQHLRLKMAPVALLKDVILVDSPGMIDAATEGADRGYDFIKAVRAHSSLVAVFFALFLVLWSTLLSLIAFLSCALLYV